MLAMTRIPRTTLIIQGNGEQTEAHVRMSRYTHSLLCYTTPGRHYTCRPPIAEPYSPPRASRTHGSQYDVSVTHPSRTARDNGKTVIRQRILRYQRRVNIIDQLLGPQFCSRLFATLLVVTARLIVTAAQIPMIARVCASVCALAASFSLGGCWGVMLAESL
ncbi:hypothetical protein HDV57DRAFT_477300 [Trichoderma longibrachiatum]|uniref:Uncharacterized protein n=1 Tax=Trichoderma longibrachiatum ATCC 18648 TaxID=983965 RepID=A0A2T4C683_TRILO|nr:hypothetical protein M440DRAFT_1242386 [Trichoderma longibrachiatum ATCC 18648]